MLGLIRLIALLWLRLRLIILQLIVSLVLMQFWMSSDAAKEIEDFSALAGYMHGFWWRFRLSRAWLSLPIAVLEFLAVALNVIIFGPLLNCVGASDGDGQGQGGVSNARMRGWAR